MGRDGGHELAIFRKVIAKPDLREWNNKLNEIIFIYKTFTNYVNRIKTTVHCTGLKFFACLNLLYICRYLRTTGKLPKFYSLVR